MNELLSLLPGRERSPQLLVRRFASPCGPLLLGAAGGRLLLCDWTASRRHATNLRRLARFAPPLPGEADALLLERAAAELEAYFDGSGRTPQAPLRLCGTPFQLAVWEALRRIPFGQTATYAAVAASLGRLRALRAVAAAIGANALSLFVPCHRVVGSGGELTGYAGGLTAKAALLRLEQGAPCPPSGADGPTAPPA